MPPNTNKSPAPSPEERRAKTAARRFWQLNQYDRSDLLGLAALLGPAKTPTGLPPRSLTRYLAKTLQKVDELGTPGVLETLCSELKTRANAHIRAKYAAKTKLYKPSRKSPGQFPT